MQFTLKIKSLFLVGAEIVTVCLVLLLVEQPSWASAETIEGVSEERLTLYDRMSKSLVLNYFGLYRGSPLNDLTNARQPLASGEIDAYSPQSIENLVTAGYKIQQDIIVGVVGHFLYFPVGNPVGDGQNIQMLDPMFLIQKNNLLNSGGFKLHGKLLVYVPLTAADTLQRNHLATGISPTLTASYDVPNTALTFAAYGYVRGYVPTAAALNDALTYKLYFAPSLSYQFSNKVAATLWVDLVSAVRLKGTPFVTGMQTDSVDIQPGVSWDVTKNININPVLNIYPANPTLASTSLQAYFSVKAF